MFTYLYWPNEWGGEVASQLRKVHTQLQMVVGVPDFQKMETELFRLVNRGVYLELVVCQKSLERTLKQTNVLKRLALSGVEVHILPLNEPAERYESFAIFDRRHLVSDTYHQEVPDHLELIRRQSALFQRLASQSEKVNPALDDVRIRFESNATEVGEGETVQLYWEVQNADFIELDPGVGAVEALGNHSTPILEDTLFRIKASNKSGILMKSVLVRLRQEPTLRLTLSVVQTGTSLSIPLESAFVNRHSYAVLRGDRLRLEWSALASGVLTEKRLGSLRLEGEHDFVVFNDEKFTFTLSTAFGEKSVDLDVVAMEDRVSTRPLGWNRSGKPDVSGRAPGSDSILARLFRWFQGLGRKHK
jgi:hypothetical protein